MSLLQSSSSHFFTSRDLSNLPPSFMFFLCPFFFVLHSLNLSFLLHCHSMTSSFSRERREHSPTPSKGEGSFGSKCKRLWITQPSLYGTPGTPPACSSLKCPTVRLILPLTPGFFLVNLGLLVLTRFQIQGRFWIYRLDEDLERQFPSSSTLSWRRLLVGPVGWTGSFLMVSL